MAHQRLGERDERGVGWLARRRLGRRGWGCALAAPLERLYSARSGLPPQTLHRRADALLAAIERGRSRTAPPPPSVPLARDPSDAPLVSLAQALVRQRSMESGVAVELIATQAELSALVGSLRRGEQADELRVARGWRRELVGDELRELVEGRRALSVDPEGGLRVTPA